MSQQLGRRSLATCGGGVRILACGLLAALVWTSGASGATLTLEDENSVVYFDPTNQAGVFDWFVDDVDHLAKQWFWFRVGSSGPEQSLDSLTLTTSVVSDPDFNGLNNTYFGRWVKSSPNPFRVEVTYTLLGGTTGSGVADITEQIRIVNTGTSVLPLSFFQYVDFDLNNTPGNDSVALINANRVQQSDPFAAVSETIITPEPSRRELAVFNSTLVKLTDGVTSNLNNNVAPIANDNVTWAFQWDINLPAGGSYIISKDKHLQGPMVIVPEPSSLMLLAAGALALIPLARGRRRD